MLKIADEPTFTHTVKVRTPIDGGFRDESVRATYRVIPSEDAAAFNLYKPDQVKRFLARVVVKLDELADASGKAIEYSDELRDRIVGGLPYVANALAKGYFDAISGAREGN